MLYLASSLLSPWAFSCAFSLTALVMSVLASLSYGKGLGLSFCISLEYVHVNGLDTSVECVHIVHVGCPATKTGVVGCQD